MPELPEVESLCRMLERELRGRVVEQVELRSFAALKTYDPPLSALRGRAVSGCARFGKFIDIELGSLNLVVHLARGGWMRLRDASAPGRPASLRGPLAARLRFAGRGAPHAPVPPSIALDITEQGTEKRLALHVVRDVRDVVGIARLGVDALDPGLTRERLGELLRGSGGSVKSVLADQSILAGIGNAYSDEILHAARISPFRTAARLDDGELERLHAAMHDSLSSALARAASAEPETLREGKRAGMNVHGRTGQPCPVCGGTIREVALSTRSFQYCPTCQTGGRIYADRRLSRLLR